MGKPGMLQSMECQRVGHNLATEQLCGKKKKTFKIIMLDQKTEGEKIDKFYLKTQSLRKLGHY